MERYEHELYQANKAWSADNLIFELRSLLAHIEASKKIGGVDNKSLPPDTPKNRRRVEDALRKNKNFRRVVLMVAENFGII